MKKILAITNIFPDKNHPYRGIFIKDQIEKLQNKYDITILFLAPLFGNTAEFIFNNFLGKKLHLDLQIDKKIKKYNIVKINFLYIPFCTHITKFISLCLYILFHGQKFDILTTYYALEHGYIANLLGKLFHKPVLIYAIGSDINCFFSKDIYVGSQIKKRTKDTLKKSKKIIAVSDDLKQKIVKLGVSPDIVEIIPFGVDEKIFHPISKSSARKNLHLDKDARIILFVGNIYYSKGLNYLIHAFHKVTEQFPNSKLIMIGEGDDKNKLVELIEKYNMFESVMFVKSQNHSRIPLWINASDVVCLPSLAEGQGLIVEEALCCGRPVIATKVGGIVEAIKGTDTGILVAAKDSKSLADALRESFVKQWNEKKIVAAGRLFSWKVIVPKLVYVLNNL